MQYQENQIYGKAKIWKSKCITQQWSGKAMWRNETRYEGNENQSEWNAKYRLRKSNETQSDGNVTIMKSNSME